MTSEATGTTAGDSGQPIRYATASTINVTQQGSTTPAPNSQRSVATRLTEGELAIRYTPRDTPPPSGETR